MSEMTLTNLKPRPGAKHRVKRLGCGESSGHGKTSGKGHKGQKARSGGSIRLGFEGGQMPLARRMPKRGFNNTAFRVVYAVVNIGDLNRFPEGATVGETELLAAGLIRRPYEAVKVLGTGTLERKLNVTVNKASETAKTAIEALGGTLTLL
jgi:large subunit ribosomal protein L15